MCEDECEQFHEIKKKTGDVQLKDMFKDYEIQKNVSNTLMNGISSLVELFGRTKDLFKKEV